jgi:hypothetical protein
VTDPTGTAALTPDRLGHGGAFCLRCTKPMREGTPVLRQPDGVLCADCAPVAVAAAAALTDTAADIRAAVVEWQRDSGIWDNIAFGFGSHISAVGLIAVLDERDRLAQRVAELEGDADAMDPVKAFAAALRYNRDRGYDTDPCEPSEVVWLTTDGEGNFGVWNDPDRARRQLVHDWTAETPGSYEWVNDADRTRELLLRDGEPTGLTLRMALVADADEGT